jgi:hypothetical protein
MQDGRRLCAHVLEVLIRDGNATGGPGLVDWKDPRGASSLDRLAPCARGLRLGWLVEDTRCATCTNNTLSVIATVGIGIF